MFKMLTLAAWTNALLALLLWCGFALMVWQLGEARLRVAARESDMRMQEDRDRSSAQLQTLLRETRDDRTALESFIQTDALAAAAAIEAAGRRAGVTVTIGGATQVPLEGVQSTDVRAITIVANGEGEFSEIMHASELFEALPFPSRVENYELSSLTPTKTQKDPWRMSARIRVLIPADAGL